MTTEPHFHGNFAKLISRIQASFALVLLLALGGLDYFFPTHYHIQAAVHGTSAIAAIVAATLLTHRAYHLLRGVPINLASLRHWCVASTLLNLLGLISGNWIYMRYRGEGGPRNWILDNVPEFHKVLMEFKEFICLFPFPLMLAVSFSLYYYGEHLQQRRDITQFIGLTLIISWAFLMFGLVGGLVLAKLQLV